jgi:atlastin
MSALAVIKVNDGKLELDETQLKKILLHPKVKSKSVMAISIAGALRNGKSTMINFIKRFLERGGIQKEWIGSPKEPLIGFDWNQGNKAVTQGIMIWSEPFDLKLNGKDVAVLLLDTQGAFEIGSDTAINSAIFTLSTLISSVQIFNTMRMINQIDLELLTLFCKYATAISTASEHKEEFQKLILLIRDWSSPANIDYGEVLLHEYLDKSQNREHCSQEWKQIETEFINAFDHISCYLMPHPGKRMATFQKGKPEYDGRIEELDDEFIEYLKEFIKTLLENGVIKKFNKNEVTGEQLFILFKGFYETFKYSKVQTPSSAQIVVST